METIERKMTDADTCFSPARENYSLEEQYRLQYRFEDGTIVYGRVEKFVRKMDKDSCQGFAHGPCVSNRITLVCPSKWEIYDQYGVIIKTGNSAVIYIDDLPKGGYFLNFGNTTAEFFKQ